MKPVSHFHPPDISAQFAITLLNLRPKRSRQPRLFDPVPCRRFAGIPEELISDQQEIPDAEEVLIIEPRRTVRQQPGKMCAYCPGFVNHWHILEPRPPAQVYVLVVQEV